MEWDIWAIKKIFLTMKYDHSMIELSQGVYGWLKVWKLGIYWEAYLEIGL